MPQFLEDRLRSQAGLKGMRGKRADRYIYGTMNRLGAMRGNRITPKGRRMERKHRREMRRAGR